MMKRRDVFEKSGYNGIGKSELEQETVK